MSKQAKKQKRRIPGRAPIDITLKRAVNVRELIVRALDEAIVHRKGGYTIYEFQLDEETIRVWDPP